MRIYSLSLVHLALLTRLAAPVVVLPYLSTVLKAELWGVIALGLAYYSLITGFIEFGFGITGARRVAKNRRDTSKVANIIISILIIQSLLSVIAVLSMLAVYQSSSLWQSYRFLFWGFCFSGILQGLSLFWYFRGVEKYFLVSWLEIITKIFYVVLVIWFVSWKDNIYFIPLILIVLNAIAFIICVFALKVRIKKIAFSYDLILDLFKESIPFFMVRVSALLITSGNTLLVGYFLSVKEAGYFAICEKIITFVRYLFSPIIDVFTPKLSRAYEEARSYWLAFYTKLSILIFGLSLFLAICVYLVFPYLITIYFGGEYRFITEYIKYIAFVPIITAVSSALGVFWLIPQGYDKEFSMSVMIGGFFSFVFTVLIIDKYGFLGAIWGVLSSYLFITILFLWFCKVNKLYPPIVALFFRNKLEV